MLSVLNFDFPTQGDADDIKNFRLPRNALLVGVQKSLYKKTGTVTASTIDINLGVATLLAGICESGAGTSTTHSWRSKHLGGSEEPVELTKDAKVSIDVNQTGAGSNDFTLQLYLLWAEL